MTLVLYNANETPQRRFVRLVRKYGVDAETFFRHSATAGFPGTGLLRELCLAAGTNPNEDH